MPVLVVGTCDTKQNELVFARDLLRGEGIETELVDVSTRAPGSLSDVPPRLVAEHHPDGAWAVLGKTDRGEAVAAMAVAFERYALARDDLLGVLGLGGSGNTAIVTRAMRALPIGLPKLMVSTVAAGDIAPHVGESDILMLPSVTDIAGLNSLSRTIIANAAAAMAGMVRRGRFSAASAGLPVGFTMFGVTTAAVEAVKARLAGIEPIVFHATGTGGRAMEKLIDSRLLRAVVDLTTTEVADRVVGGIMPCGEDRFGAIARAGVPAVVSCGACDMVNFGALDTVPGRFRDRRLHAHNPNVTLMRTTADENVAIGRFIAERLNRCEGPVRVVLPTRGFSAIDAPGQPFHDPEADAALIATMAETLRPAARRQLSIVDAHINDAAFADAVAAAFTEIAP